jgi:hypothetical protein
MAAGHDEEGWNRLGREVMAAPGQRNGMVRLRMQAWSWRQMRKRRCMKEASTILEGDRQSQENRKVFFGENAKECARDS